MSDMWDAVARPKVAKTATRRVTALNWQQVGESYWGTTPRDFGNGCFANIHAENGEYRLTVLLADGGEYESDTVLSSTPYPTLSEAQAAGEAASRSNPRTGSKLASDPDLNGQAIAQPTGQWEDADLVDESMWTQAAVVNPDYVHHANRHLALPGDTNAKPSGANPQVPTLGLDDSAMFEPDEIKEFTGPEGAAAGKSARKTATVIESATWADGFGNWHARITQSGVGDAAEAQARAKELILMELRSRGTIDARAFSVELVSRTSQFGELHSEFVERWPSDRTGSRTGAWNEGTEWVDSTEIKVGDVLRFPPFGENRIVPVGDWPVIDVSVGPYLNSPDQLFITVDTGAGGPRKFGPGRGDRSTRVVTGSHTGGNIQAECRYCGAKVKAFGDVCKDCQGDSTNDELHEQNLQHSQYQQMFRGSSKTAAITVRNFSPTGVIVYNGGIIIGTVIQDGDSYRSASAADGTPMGQFSTMSEAVESLSKTGSSRTAADAQGDWLLRVRNTDRSLREVQQYLWSNMTASQVEDGTIYIKGHDVAGFTMDAIRDRLLSGMIGTDIVERDPDQGVKWASRRTAGGGLAEAAKVVAQHWGGQGSTISAPAKGTIRLSDGSYDGTFITINAGDGEFYRVEDISGRENINKIENHRPDPANPGKWVWDQVKYPSGTYKVWSRYEALFELSDLGGGRWQKDAEYGGEVITMNASRTAAQITDSTRSFTLAPGEENWIGNFTDEALAEMEAFWSSADGAAAQPYMPGYADGTLKLIRDEKTRRTSSRTAAHGDPYYNDADIEQAQLESGFFDEDGACPACGAVDSFVNSSYKPEFTSAKALAVATSGLPDRDIVGCAMCNAMFDNRGGRGFKRLASAASDEDDSYALWRGTGMQTLDPSVSYSIRDRQGRVIYTHVWGTEAQGYLNDNIGWTAAPQVGAYQSSRTAMPSPADAGVSVGDIFVNSWGYDQTNVDFYKVVRLTGAGVEIVPIGKKFVSQNGPGGNRVMPDPNVIRDRDVCTGIGVSWDGGSDKKSKVCKLSDGGWGTPTIVLKSGEHWASKWDGQPEHETDSQFGH